MNVNRPSIFVIAFAVGASACVPSESSIRIGNAYSGEPASGGSTQKCDLSSNIFQNLGSYDVAQAPILNGAVISRAYRVVFSVDSNLMEVDVTANGVNVTGATQNMFYYSGATVSYSSDSPVLKGVKLPNETWSLTGSLPAGTKDQRVETTILGNKVIDALYNALAPGDFEGATLLVHFAFTGRTYAGVAMTSSTFTYPIRVYNSGKTCPTGQVPLSKGLCNSAGQDGTGSDCAPAK